MSRMSFGKSFRTPFIDSSLIITSWHPAIHIHPPFACACFSSVSSWTRICSSNFWHWSKCSYGKKLGQNNVVLGKKHASKWRGYTSSVLKHAETVTFLLFVLHYFWHWTRCWGNKSFLLSTSWCDLMRLWSSFGPLYAVHNLDVSMAIVEGRRIGSMKNVSNVEKRSNVQSLLIWISIGLCSMDYGRLQVQEPQ